MKVRNNFYFPPQDVLEPNSKDDPLPYYYWPVIGYFYRQRIQQAVNLLRPHYDSILELGYGSGIMIPTLSLLSRQVYGIDNTSDPLRVRKNLHKIGVDALLIQGDICNTYLPREGFDLVVAISMIEHMKSIEGLLKKVQEILRPGGHFLVGMPRVDKFMELLFSLMGLPQIKEHHVTTYKEFLKEAFGYFDLIYLKRIPPWLPAFSSLYFNMLLQKRDKTI